MNSKNMSAKHLFSLNIDVPWKLRDLKMVSVSKFDGKTVETPQTLGYYREPMPNEYPINLNKGNQKVLLPPPSVFDELNYIKYLKSQPNAGEFDFCTSRGLLVKLGTSQDLVFVATKFRGCIFIKRKTVEQTLHKGELLQLRLKRYLIVDTPNDMPNIKKPFGSNSTNYGIFTAHLGKFRLLYSANLIGVENSEPLGDLNDPDVLQQCKLTLLKLYPNHRTNWVHNYRMKTWLLQAHLGGIDQLKVAGYTSKGTIPSAIITEDCDNLLKGQEWCLSNKLTLLHLILSEMKDVMANVDCPYTTYNFEVKNKSLSYTCLEGKTKESFLTQEYIDFMIGS